VVQVIGFLLICIVASWLIVNLVQDWDAFFRVFLIGVSNGSLYALVALGYTLVYGILELINFAHGDVFMIGGMLAATVALSMFDVQETSGIGTIVPAILVAFVVATIGCGFLNTGIERVAYRPLRGAPRLVPLITAIGVSFILEDIALIWKGSQSVALPPTLNELSHLVGSDNPNVFTIGHCPNCVVYTWPRLFSLIITVPTLIALVWLVRYTRQGKAMRATAQDKDAAAMMGINVNRTISFTFLIAGILAGAAGTLWAFYFQTIRFDTGFTVGLIAFTAAVLGGIGNLPGAVLGGMLIGLIQAFNEGLVWHSPGPAWTEAIVFSILIIILVFRPQGLLGEQTPEGG
jgi:branched-chain amino acid transport system permease protein